MAFTPAGQDPGAVGALEARTVPLERDRNASPLWIRLLLFAGYLQHKMIGRMRRVGVIGFGQVCHATAIQNPIELGFESLYLRHTFNGFNKL